MLVKKRLIITDDRIKYIYLRSSTKENFISLVSPFWKIENLQKKFKDWTYTFCTFISI